MTRPFTIKAAAKAVSLEERVFMLVSLAVVIRPYPHNTARAVLVANPWIAFVLRNIVNPRASGPAGAGRTHGRVNGRRRSLKPARDLHRHCRALHLNMGKLDALRE
jgi:hypothetical protein